MAGYVRGGNDQFYCSVFSAVCVDGDVYLCLDALMKLSCICCKGEGYVVVWAAHPEVEENSPQRLACAYCSGTGYVKLTPSEAKTYAKGQEP